MPISQEPQVIILRLGTKGITTTQDLSGKKVGAIQGSRSASLLAKGQGTEVTEETEGEFLYNDLMAGRVDAIIVDKIAGDQWSHDPISQGKIAIVGSTGLTEDYGIAVKKGNGELLSKINAGLESLKRSGELAVILKPVLE